MSKKLPGLNRRAPEMENDGTADSDAPESDAASTASPPDDEAQAARSGKRRSRARVTEAGVSEGDRILAVEMLAPESSDDAAVERLSQALAVVRRRANWAMGGGAIPVPIVDAVAIAGVQLTMLSELSALYGVPFERNRARSIISALVGSVVPYGVGAGLGGLVMKSMPVLGWAVGLATVALLARAMTRAIGTVFIQHFESGGVLLDFDTVVGRSRFRQEFERARKT
jgi:uncharacterized protein (DUF697 family)